MVKESKLGKAELEVHCNRSVNLCDLLPLSYFWLELSELSDWNRNVPFVFKKIPAQARLQELETLAKMNDDAGKTRRLHDDSCCAQWKHGIFPFQTSSARQECVDAGSEPVGHLWLWQWSKHLIPHTPVLGQHWAGDFGGLETIHISTCPDCESFQVISNVVVSSFVIIYHVLLTAIWRMFQILPVAGRSAAEVQMASLGEFVCGQQVPYVEARVPRGLRWHIGGREHCALDIRYDQRWIDRHTERTKLNKLNNKRQNMTWTYWMKIHEIHEIRGTCTNILDAPKWW